MRHFPGATAYITGGSSGIGLSTAKLLAAHGAHVIIFARDKKRLEEARIAIEGRRISDHQRFASAQVDVARAEQVEKVMEQAVAAFGVPDLLINCAGRACPRCFEDISYRQFDETMKINLYGAWNTIKALVPHMKRAGGGGAIVNVSSMAGLIGVFGYADYAASKFALIGLSEVLRSELKPYRIHVSVLCPPDTDTPGFEAENLTKPPETKAVSSAARLMHPDAVAAALLRGVKKGSFLIVPNVESTLAFLAKRLYPSLVERYMDRAIEKTRREQGGDRSEDGSPGTERPATHPRRG